MAGDESLRYRPSDWNGDYQAYRKSASTPSDYDRRTIEVLGYALTPLLRQIAQVASEHPPLSGESEPVQLIAVDENLNRGTPFVELPANPRFSHLVQQTTHDRRMIMTVPVGYYGVPVASALVQTATALYETTEKYLSTQMDEAFRTYRELFTRETYRGYPQLVIGEGIQTTGVMIGQMLSQRVGEIENPLQALQAAHQADVLGKLGRRSPLGFLFPLTIAGYMLGNPPLTTDKEGKLDLHPDVNVLLQKKKAEFNKKNPRTEELSRKRGCPVARSFVDEETDEITPHGIHEITEAFLTYLPYFL